MCVWLFCGFLRPCECQSNQKLSFASTRPPGFNRLPLAPSAAPAVPGTRPYKQVAHNCTPGQLFFKRSKTSKNPPTTIVKIPFLGEQVGTALSQFQLGQLSPPRVTPCSSSAVREGKGAGPAQGLRPTPLIMAIWRRGDEIDDGTGDLTVKHKGPP